MKIHVHFIYENFDGLSGKLALSSLAICDEKFKETSVPFFISDFNLLSCELDNCTFKVLYRVILYYIKAI